MENLNSKKRECESYRKCLPLGKLNSFIHCYECSAAEYDEDRKQYWCHKFDRWEGRGSGCILSPDS